MPGTGTVIVWTLVSILDSVNGPMVEPPLEKLYVTLKGALPVKVTVNEILPATPVQILKGPPETTAVGRYLTTSRVACGLVQPAPLVSVTRT